MKAKYLHGLITGILLSLLSVTSVNAEYLGCFRDESNRDLNGATWNNSQLTTESCLKFCTDVGFSYAGTQFGTQCFCGNTYGSYGQSNDCQTPCAGSANQLCGGILANSVYHVDYITDIDVFTPFTGKTWRFNNERSNEEITFDTMPTDDTLFGLDTAGQLWGMDYSAEDNIYMLLRVEKIGNETNAFTYQFACENCTSITGQYLIIYNVNSAMETTEGPFFADGQLTLSTDLPLEIEALTIFTGETWIFSSERSNEEITFDPTVRDEGNLFGVDTKGQLWLLAYRIPENNYFLFTLQEIGDKTNIFDYVFTCDSAYCERVNGSYLITYDHNGISETTDGIYPAIKG